MPTAGLTAAPFIDPAGANAGPVGGRRQDGCKRRSSAEAPVSISVKQQGTIVINAQATLTTAGTMPIDALVAAIGDCPAQDALRCQLTAPQWVTLANYLQALDVLEGRVLIERGAPDRAVYFVESGSLSVHHQDGLGRVRMAIISAGSVVGEGSFFSHLPRAATVQAFGPAKLWFLSPLRFLELANRHSPIALELTLALGSVMSRRLYNRARRVAVC